MFPVTQQNSQCLLYWDSEGGNQEEASDVHCLCYPQVTFHHEPCRKYKSIIYNLHLVGLFNALGLVVTLILFTTFCQDAKDSTVLILINYYTRNKGNIKKNLFNSFCFYICLWSTVDPRKSNGLILQQLETWTKNSRKIRFETRIKIRKSNHKLSIAQHRVAHATVSQQIRTRLVECCWSVCASARPVLL
jgi:hypothetical protein